MKKTLMVASLLASLALAGCNERTNTSSPQTDAAPGSAAASGGSMGGDPTQAGSGSTSDGNEPARR